MPHPESAPWTLRYTATQLGFPEWAKTAPDRLAIVTNRSGSWQVWTHDLGTGGWRQASDEPIGVESVQVAPDGRIVWFSDATGDETGGWVSQPFEGGPVTPLAAGLPVGWSTGLAMAGSRIAAGFEIGGEYSVFVADEGAPPQEIYRSSTPSGVGSEWPAGRGGLSPDGRMLCVRHTEHGDLLRPSLRILDADTGRTVADLDDAVRRGEAGPWSPDGRSFAFTNELGEFERPSVWNAQTGARRDLVVDLPGAVIPVEWLPEDRLLVRHEHEARAQLFRLDTDTGELDLACDPEGDIDDAAIRPDGSIWLRTSSGTRPPRIIDETGVEVVKSPDPSPPPGSPLRSYWFENAHGERVHALVATPEGDGPFPLVMSVHGGPEWHERDRYDPETQAFVDAGYAVALPNYRGSTGYGVAFREALIGNVCFTETEDILACLDALSGEGVADPERVFWSGWSWGGCLACFNAGTHPDRWRAVFAGIPAGDFIAAHWASAPELQAWDDAVYGGSPDDVPDAYARSNPMSYVDAVRAPTIVIAGESDPRCPLEGVTPWVDAVRANGVPVDVHLYPAGHHANTMDDQVHHMQLVLDFFAGHA
jgi:dipeptidyl aminopeptidase/acylaminoacyl peptidase